MRHTKINKGSFTLWDLTTGPSRSYKASMCTVDNEVAYPLSSTGLFRPHDIDAFLRIGDVSPESTTVESLCSTAQGVESLRSTRNGLCSYGNSLGWARPILSSCAARLILARFYSVSSPTKLKKRRTYNLRSHK